MFDFIRHEVFWSYGWPEGSISGLSRFIQGRYEGLIVAIGGLRTEQRASIVALAARQFSKWSAQVGDEGYLHRLVPISVCV